MRITNTLRLEGKEGRMSRWRAAGADGEQQEQKEEEEEGDDDDEEEERIPTITYYFLISFHFMQYIDTVIFLDC